MSKDWSEVTREKGLEECCGNQEFICSQRPHNPCTVLSSGSSEVFTCTLLLFFYLALSQATQERVVSMV